MAASRGRREPEEEHAGGHERWLITYADMITLLMVLFIVLFAISQVDQKRFEMLKEGMAAGFGQTSSPFQGAESVMPEEGLQPIAPIQQAAMDDPDFSSPLPTEQEDRRSARSEQVQEASTYAEAQAEVERLNDIRERIERALRQHGLENDVQMAIDQRGLTVSLVSKYIVFAPNLARLTPRGVEVLDVIAPVLRGVPDRLDIDGHTNQVPVKPKYYPTDWELSADRAVTVLRHLSERGGIDGSRLAAVAHGHEKPLIDPSRPR
jgi:chemotaxis protein MotB